MFVKEQSSSETVKQDLDRLTNEQLQQVADPSQLTALTEFAQEDRALAEAGINGYAAMLRQEIDLDEPLEIDRTSTTPMQHAGILETDPTFDDWMDKLAEIRRSANEINDDEL
jgi:hypothetical protein